MNLAKLEALMHPGTPLIPGADPRLLYKLEGVGPNPAHKCRSAAWVIRQAIRDGRPLRRVADRTSGSWAIGLALAAQAVGATTRFVTVGEPEPAITALVEANGGSFERVATNPERITALARLQGEGWWSPDQHNNPGMIAAFEETLGSELVADLVRAGVGPADLRFVAAPVGTGGTLAGVSRKLRRNGYRQFRAVGVDLTSSIVHGGTRSWAPEQFKVPGVGSADELCGTLRIAAAEIDELLTASAFDAITEVRRFFGETPQGCGMSGGLTLAAVRRHLLPLCPPHGRILVILPDTAWRYSTQLAAGNRLLGGVPEAQS